MGGGPGWRLNNGAAEEDTLQSPSLSPGSSTLSPWLSPWPPKHFQGSLVATTASTTKSLFSVRSYKACQAAKGVESRPSWDSALELVLSPVGARDGRVLGGAGGFLFQHQFLLCDFSVKSLAALLLKSKYLHCLIIREY